MKLAASNIGWAARDDAAVLPLLATLGFEGLEVAPTRLWPEPLLSTAAERRALRGHVESLGLRVVAMQALVFGRPDLKVFGESASREALLRHLEGMIDLGADLGARVLVFGSPKNRSAAGLSPAQVEELALPFFRRLGEAASARGVSFCIEHNPPGYGCDFVTTADEAAALVERVASPGFGLHLDGGGLTISGGAESAARRLAASARHFHISEPDLAPVGTGTTEHRALAAALRAGGYGGWASVEMRTPEGARPLEQLEQSLRAASQSYRSEQT